MPPMYTTDLLGAEEDEEEEQVNKLLIPDKRISYKEKLIM